MLGGHGAPLGSAPFPGAAGTSPALRTAVAGRGLRARRGRARAPEVPVADAGHTGTGEQRKELSERMFRCGAFSTLRWASTQG